MQLTKHFAARFFAAPEPGQIGPTEHHAVYVSPSEAAAKRTAKARAQTNGWRLVSLDRLEEAEKEEYRLHGWYVNTITI